MPAKQRINSLETPIAVLGAGSWGTALAIHLARSHQCVHLWEYDQDRAELLKRERKNQLYLPDVSFPDSIQVFSDLSLAVQNVCDILIVVPSFAFRGCVNLLKPLIGVDVRIAWATKGIDPDSNQLLHQVVEEILGKQSVAILSGPSFAGEVASKLPTAVTLASNDQIFSEDCIARFNHNVFRVYANTDLIGVQLGGAIKNVIAIAVGISDGLHYGANARSALITRGLAEIARLGVAMGAKKETFFGLSGMGDLVLTCTDNQSRNRRFGLALGEGKNILKAQEEIGQVVEGVHNAKQVMMLAKRYEVVMPICEAVNQILQNQLTPQQVVEALFSRSTKMES